MRFGKRLSFRQSILFAIFGTYVGFATVGSKMELNAGIHLTPVVDANFKGFYSVNGFDINSYTNMLSQQTPGTVWKTAGRSYDIYGGMVGLSYAYPKLGKFVADV